MIICWIWRISLTLLSEIGKRAIKKSSHKNKNAEVRLILMCPKNLFSISFSFQSWLLHPQKTHSLFIKLNCALSAVSTTASVSCHSLTGWERIKKRFITGPFFLSFTFFLSLYFLPFIYSYNCLYITRRLKWPYAEQDNHFSYCIKEEILVT